MVYAEVCTRAVVLGFAVEPRVLCVNVLITFLTEQTELLSFVIHLVRNLQSAGSQS